MTSRSRSTIRSAGPDEHLANLLLWQTVLIPLGKFVSAGRGRRVPVISLFGLEYAVFGSFPDVRYGQVTQLVGRTGDLWLHSDCTIRTMPGKVVATFDQLEPSKYSSTKVR